MTDQPPKTPAEAVASLTEQDLRTLGLVALGWSGDVIAKKLGVHVNTLKKRVDRIKIKLGMKGGSRTRLALFYVEHVLPVDMLGQPRDRAKQRYTELGEKLADWQAAAIETRAQLRAAGALAPRHVEIAMLLTNPDNADMTLAELSGLLSGDVKPQPTTTQVYMSAMISQINNGTRLKLAVIATLAPFDEPDAVSS